jgi:hypothetical protein
MSDAVATALREGLLKSPKPSNSITHRKSIGLMAGHIDDFTSELTLSWSGCWQSRRR